MKSLTVLLIIALSFPSALSRGIGKHNEGEVKGMFVFGSSLVDNGNNNYIKDAAAKANFPPYGLDFPLGPTGRFSNGKNPVDVLGELLKIPGFIPPFTDPRTRGDRTVHGVNFASGGSGILDQTGSLNGVVMSMNQQIKHFEMTTLPELRAQKKMLNLSKYLFVVGTGGNDYLLSYFLSPQKGSVTLQTFTHTLISNLSQQLKKLYDLGARKFVVFSIQAMGCYPVVRKTLQTTNGTCVEAINEAAILFNSHLRSFTNSTTKSLMPGSNMVFIDSYKIITDIIHNPMQTGFSDTSRACCEVSSIMGGGNGILCERRGRACSDRGAHVFFDGLHPTEAVNVRIAHKAYGSKLGEEAYPINVKQLARL